ncbi:MAG: FAD-dependent oxidoreductase [Candidatus Acidiferrales bacterium]
MPVELLTETEKITRATITNETSCCVVGCGPAGAMLALLLARRGVSVTLLEMHKDFDREFRGDTVHPSTLEILDQLGLADRLHQLRHSKVFGPTLLTATGPFTPIDFRQLKTKYPYILMVPQKYLLDLLTQEAAKYPNFRILMGANATELIEQRGTVRGVRYMVEGATHDLRALLVVGADGRFSHLRQLAGIKPIGISPPMDVLWFRLPHLPSDPEAPGGAFGNIGKGHLIIGLDRADYWQAGYVILKGTYQEIRAEGIEGFRRRIVGIDPRLTKHVESLTDWHQIAVLSVESSRCPIWYKPGLLLIGDAAHVMSPVGGVGINYAIQDAVVAANVLTKPLLSGRVTLGDLKTVQRKRVWPVRLIQVVQTQIQKTIIAGALRSQQRMQIPWIVRLFFSIPYLRNIPARIMAYGLVRVHVEN